MSWPFWSGEKPWLYRTQWPFRSSPGSWLIALRAYPEWSLEDIFLLCQNKFYNLVNAQSSASPLVRLMLTCILSSQKSEDAVLTGQIACVKYCFWAYLGICFSLEFIVCVYAGSLHRLVWPQTQDLFSWPLRWKDWRCEPSCPALVSSLLFGEENI